MFRCQNCGVTTAPKVKANFMVVQSRDVVYVNHNMEGDEIISKGKEIVKEIKVCPACVTFITHPFPVSKGGSQ